MKLKGLIVIIAVALMWFLGCGDEEKVLPSPESVTPSKSCNTARTDVEITGKGFMAQIKENLDDKAEIITKITASLGSYPLEKIAFHSSRKLTAVVPAGLPPGVYNLIITNPDGEMGILPDAVEVTNISGVEPVVGCLGEPVTISGSYFGPDAGTVSFNETETEVISWSDTSIVVSAPGGDYTEVRVVPAAGHLSSIPGSYSYDGEGPTGLVASPAGGRYCPTMVSLSVSEGTIYYTLDGSEPTNESQIYTEPIAVSKGTLKSIAVDACGNRTSIVSEFYDIDEVAPTGLVAEPVGGSYCGTIMVSLSASEGTIYFTTDHTYPTTASPAYTGPIEVTANITAIKFMAVDTCGNQSSVKIDYYNVDTEPPTSLSASPAGGSYCATAVSLSASTGTIYYTLDGSGPTTMSPVYMDPIDIIEDKTLKFMAVDSCGNQSGVASEIYNIDNEAPTGLAATPASGIYCATMVSLSTSEGTIYYTVNGDEPSPGGLVYTEPISINEYTLLLFMAEDACGNLSGIYDEVYDIDNVAPTGLTATPAGGSYCATTVSLSASDGTIYYTLDGSSPTTLSPVYTAPIDINMDKTLNFMAVDECGNWSGTMTEIYTIDTGGPTSLLASPASGTYCATTVSLSASDGTIYYTLDGSGPTTLSPVYTAPIDISMDKTLKFIAVDECGNWS
ncbi:MAG: chitobiase/beta-hexosaminidase C-terminal domain-containing protein, partial [Deltaproteobacteria bacterium]